MVVMVVIGEAMVEVTLVETGEWHRYIMNLFFFDSTIRIFFARAIAKNRVD